MFNLPDRDYLQYIIEPYMKTRFNTVTQLHLPMIDFSYSTENALPPYLWGLLWRKWEPNPDEGNTVFLQDYRNRGPHNYKKKIYYSGVTPDLYRDKFKAKVCNFFKRLLDDDHAGLPLMRRYLDSYFYLYWDLHLGASGQDVPFYAIEVGHCVNACLAQIDPFDKDFYRNYMRARELRDRQDNWIDQRLEAIESGKVDGADKTMAYYWLKNAKEGDRPKDLSLKRGDVVFECFHNFVALSQWGNTIYHIMDKLRVDGGDPAARKYFGEMVDARSYNERDGGHFTRLERFIMELFRTIMPNGGSISTKSTPTRLRSDQVFATHDHDAISNDRVHWDDPEAFDPQRYIDKPTSDEIDEGRCKEYGFAQCPFSKNDVVTADDRGTVTNSGFGTVYNVGQEGAEPVLDYAGYGPFGFGYRRCPGELFTVEVIKEFLSRVARRDIEFRKLEGEAQRVPVGPGTVVEDNIGFTKKPS